VNLYLMRHGIAVADGAEIHSDSERPLTPKGAKRLRRAVCGLAKLDIVFSSVLTSPLLRARQTAEIVAQSLGLETKLEEVSELAPGSSVEQLIAGLARFRHQEDVLLVGHEPLLSQLASFLLLGKSKPNLNMRFRKGGLCCIEIDHLPLTNPGLLHWHLTPKQLRLLSSNP
jgi:phosphohistidine phosphatase